MRLIYSTCDYCGAGTHSVRFDGGGYCSHACASAAELARRRGGKDLRTRQIVAREAYKATESRKRDQAGSITIGLALLALVLILCSGCDSPNDVYGPDERAHIAQGHRIGGIE